MRNHLFFCLLAFFLAACNNTDKETITLEMLLDEMVSVEETARYPYPYYTCHQESSYDRLSVSPDSANWFANADGFGIIRIDSIGDRIEKVMFDESGPGVITRIWITTIDKRGVWRFYFDGADSPGLTIPAYDLMQIGIPSLGKGLLQAHTSYTPEGKGGNTLFLPIPNDILDKYEDHPHCQLKGVLLPVMCNKKMNSYLKEIAHLCGITKNLTTHTARHIRGFGSVFSK